MNALSVIRNHFDRIPFAFWFFCVSFFNHPCMIGRNIFLSIHYDRTETKEPEISDISLLYLALDRFRPDRIRTIDGNIVTYPCITLESIARRPSSFTPFEINLEMKISIIFFCDRITQVFTQHMQRSVLYHKIIIRILVCSYVSKESMPAV